MEAWDNLFDEMKAMSARLELDVPTEDELSKRVFQTLTELSACTSRPATTIEELVQNMRRWSYLSSQLYMLTDLCSMHFMTLGDLARRLQ